MASKQKSGLFVVISGPAGTGKGTVISALMRKSDEFAYSVSATTRACRHNEIDGLNYHFVSREQFKQYIENDEVIEYTDYCGNYYGTLRSELEKTADGHNLILEIEVKGAKQIKARYPDAVTVFVLPPNFSILERRLRNRHTNTEDDIANRLRTAIDEVGRLSEYDYIVYNNDGRSDEAADRILDIVRVEQMKTHRNPDVIGSFTEQYRESGSGYDTDDLI